MKYCSIEVLSCSSTVLLKYCSIYVLFCSRTVLLKYCSVEGLFCRCLGRRPNELTSIFKGSAASPLPLPPHPLPPPLLCTGHVLVIGRMAGRESVTRVRQTEGWPREAQTVPAHVHEAGHLPIRNPAPTSGRQAGHNPIRPAPLLSPRHERGEVERAGAQRCELRGEGWS